MEGGTDFRSTISAFEKKRLADWAYKRWRGIILLILDAQEGATADRRRKGVRTTSTFFVLGKPFLSTLPKRGKLTSDVVERKKANVRRFDMVYLALGYDGRVDCVSDPVKKNVLSEHYRGRRGRCTHSCLLGEVRTVERLPRYCCWPGNSGARDRPFTFNGEEHPGEKGGFPLM